MNLVDENEKSVLIVGKGTNPSSTRQDDEEKEDTKAQFVKNMFKKRPPNYEATTLSKEKMNKKVYVYLTGDQKFCPQHHRLRLFYSFGEDPHGA